MQQAKNTTGRPRRAGRAMRWAAVLLAAALLLALCACGAQPAAVSSSSPASAPAGSAADAGVTFTDALGRTVTVKAPRRVAVLIGSFADIWLLAGGGDTIVAVADDSWTQFELPLAETVVDLGGAKKPSAEALLAAQPDFVIASAQTSADVELLPILEQAGITTAYFSVSTFEEYLGMLELCTRITNCPERYEQYGTAVRRQVEDALGRAQGREGPRVLYLRASAGGCKVKNSEGSVLGEMLKALGCANIADSDASLLETLSMESILTADPDQIFIVLQGNDTQQVRETLQTALLDDPAWQQLRAVRDGACHFMDQRLYNLKPNARWGEAYEALAELLYGGKAASHAP